MSQKIGRFARFLSRHPKAILIFSIILTISAVYVASHLEIKSSLTELLPQDTEHVKNLNEISKRAGGVGYLMVAVDGNKPEAMYRFAEDLYEKIKDNSLIRFIYYKNDLEFIKKHALLFLSKGDLERAAEFIENKMDEERAKLNPFYIDLLGDLEPEKKEDSFKDINKLLEKYSILRRQYLVNNENNFLVMLIKPREVAANMKSTTKLVNSVQAAITELNPAGYDADLKVQLNGRYMTQFRDNQTITKDLRSTSIISALLILISLSVMFKKRRTFIIIGLPLFMGLAWTFGLTYLIIGELNLITTFLVAILLGLGINFGIHFFKRYLEFRETHEPEEAVILMYTSSAVVSSITASLTTAVAFFSLVFTQFKGFNQFGLIAGTGAIFTLAAYFLTFPSLIILYERYYPLKNAKTHLFPRIHFAEKLLRHASGLTYAFYGLLLGTFLLIFFSTRINFEYDFNKLGSATRENFVLKNKINNLFDTSLSPTVVMVDSPEESRQTVDAVSEFIRQGSKTLVTVKDINSLVPTEQEAKIEIIKRVKQLSQDKLFTFLEGEEKALFEEFSQYLDVEPLTLDMLPPYLTMNFQGQTNSNDRFVLIYPGIELGDGKQIMTYAAELDKIVINGKKLKTCSESLILADILKLITRDGTVAIILTLIAILIILWLHFKRFIVMGLVLLPILLGTVALLGVMGMFGIKSNFINIVAFPIILGIGIDNSVHFYHRYKEDGSLWFAFYHTGMAMFLTTLTTIIGFGSLLFAQHRGLQSLGIVAVLGLALNLLATFLILPILIKINNQFSFRILGFSWKNTNGQDKQLTTSSNEKSAVNSTLALANSVKVVPANNRSTKSKINQKV